MSTTPPTTPFWFKQRQGKLESAGDYAFKAVAPNQNPAYIRIRFENGLWGAAVRTEADGPDVASTPPRYTEPWRAWDAAFELYRQAVIV